MFDLNDIKEIYNLLNENGCKSVLSNELFNDISEKRSKSRYLIKHDVHKDLKRTLFFAELEADMGVKSVYFVMPDHDLTNSYFGSRYMWGVYDRLSQLDHELALHLDVHDLIIKYGGVNEGVKIVTDIFRENGFEVHSANFHGNTALRKIYGSPKALIRKKDSDKKSLSHKFPIIDKEFQAFYASGSLETLARDFGILNWLDSGFLRAGDKVEIPSYCTDNSGSLRLGWRGVNLLKSEKFELDRKFKIKLVEHCRKSTTLFLLHPQFYNSY